MATPAPAVASSSVFRFDRNRRFLGGKLDIGVSVTGAKDPDVLLALAGDTPFPDRQIKIGRIELGVDAGDKIQFGSGKKKVTFNAKASAFSGLGVYPDPKNMLRDLRPDSNIAPGVEFPPADPTSHYLMLRWGYDLSASAKGALALGTGGSFTFGAEGSRQGAFAVVRRFADNTGARTAVAKTVQSWMLPRQVTSESDLAPGTWLVAEVNGSVGASLGVQFGYDFNWVREAKLGGLTGDIGLRLQLGVAAAVGFKATGKYAVVLSRESTAPAVQLRLFKLSTRGWNFAFNAGATVKGDFSKFLPDRADDFVKAVFGVHGEQIIQDLHAIEKWTDPDTPLSDQLAGLSSKYVQRFLKDATGIDPKTAFNDARQRVLDLFNKWDELPHRVTSQLWKFIEDKVNLDPVRDIAATIANSTQKELARKLAGRLGEVGFFTTPEGKLLQALAERGILAALDSNDIFKKLQSEAKQVLGLLDGSTLEATLVRLQGAIAKRLNLDKVRKAVEQTDFDKLDAWLQAKLSEFLGEKLNLQRLEQIRKTINVLLAKRQEFYEKAAKALNRQYEFSFSHTYQSTTTKTALFDIEFDFSQGTQVAGLLKAAINGDFDRVMVKQAAGVKLNVAALTHGIERQSHVEISLPFFNKKLSHINRALAKSNAVDEEEGRVLVYDLSASDRMLSIVESKMVRDSALAIGGAWRVRAGNTVRRHNADAVSYSYQFRQARLRMKTADLQFQLQPYVEKYFPDSFSVSTNGGIAESFHTWVQVLDRTVEESENNGADIFGDTLISLDLSLPGAIASAWLNAPAKKPRSYIRMSHAIQAALKELIPFYYFQDPSNYADLDSAAPLLLYSAIPPSTSIRVQGNTVTRDTGKDVYWNWPARDQREKMAGLPSTSAKLAEAVRRAFDTLSSRPELNKHLQFYRPDDGKARKRILKTSFSGHGTTRLQSLLRNESIVVQSAYEAGVAMAKFREEKSTEPTKAVQALQKFGSKLTEAFNANIKSAYGEGALRPLGTLVFAAAARGLLPATAAAEARQKAILSLIVLKEGAGFTLKDFAKNQVPGAADVAVEERLVSLS